MTERSAQHGSFTIERKLNVAPTKVYTAWSTLEGKSRWFTAPSGEWQQQLREFDFRVGGRERLVGRWKSGMVTDFRCQYLDIVPQQRIVYTYDMHVDERRISISLATIEFKPADGGTQLIVTEQGVFLDGYDDVGSREKGTGSLMDNLERALRG
jgi:uncharacterized protein YndB with AHSA1/START domain